MTAADQFLIEAILISLGVGLVAGAVLQGLFAADRPWLLGVPAGVLFVLVAALTLWS